MSQPPHTSSRNKACLNTLIVVLTSTKGRNQPIKTPALATVSQSINRFSAPSIPRGHELYLTYGLSMWEAHVVQYDPIHLIWSGMWRSAFIVGTMEFIQARAGSRGWAHRLSWAFVFLDTKGTSGPFIIYHPFTDPQLDFVLSNLKL
jgi:hypothetical protein